MIIGMHGQTGSGKDTVADFLVAQEGFKKMSFAARLYEMLLALDPMVDYLIGQPVHLQHLVDTIGWRRAKDEVPEVRRMLQRLATEVIRDLVDPNYFVKFIDQQIGRLDDVVITDLRFANEYDWLMSRTDGGSEVWWVQRPGNDKAIDESHSSEQWHPPRDSGCAVVMNAGTLDDLECTVSDMFISE